jgi:excinuclease UvrABC nuclease subunit
MTTSELTSTVPALMRFEKVHESGVYFLCRAKTVVYVGRSRNLICRIGEHIRSLEFDEVFYVPCIGDEMVAMEKRYISTIKPEHNKFVERQKGQPRIRGRVNVSISIDAYRIGEKLAKRENRSVSNYIECKVMADIKRRNVD